MIVFPVTLENEKRAKPARFVFEQTEALSHADSLADSMGITLFFATKDLSAIP